MRRVVLMLTTMLLAAALLGSAAIGTAVADPTNNYRLKVPASCNIDGKTQNFEFLINGEGVAGHILGSTSNIMPVKDTTTYKYTDPATGEPVETVVKDQLGKGNKNGLQRDLKQCTGTVTYQDPDLGQVTAKFDILAFFTPRGNK